jgi:Dyp-type peroxidase family
MAGTERLTPEAKADIQGFITSGYGHLPCGAYLFLQVRDRVQAQSWLAAILPEVTTATSWRAHAGEDKSKPRATLNIAFTCAGLSRLGLPDTALATFPVEFQTGMGSGERARMLGDTGTDAPEHWEIGGPGHADAIHVILILNAESPAALDEWRTAQRNAILRTNGGVTELADLAQAGSRPDHGKEPFGFFDGVAQPEVKGIKGRGVNTGEFILGYENEYGFLPVSPLVPADLDRSAILPPPANPRLSTAFRDLGANGTYVVYRKLQQDVAAFWQYMQRESVRVLGQVDAGFMVWLAAKIVGRWPSGAPLVLAADQDQPGFAHRDDFLYAEADPHGLACPFGSHIRRTNPRDSIRPSGPRESLHMSARHRLLRRGKPYGEPLFDLTALDRLDDRARLERAIVDLRSDGCARGIHFFCINANIKSQFEFVQQAWSNNPRFNGGLAVAKPSAVLEGQEADPAGSLLIPGRPFGLRTAAPPRFVMTRGGAYFFMPAVAALRFLAGM